MLASLACAPGAWLAVIGRAASPSEKTARPHIVSRLEAKRAAEIKSIEIKAESWTGRRSVAACARRAPRPRRVRTARSWRGIVPFTHLARGGAYDSHHRTAGIAGRTRRRSGRVAARGAAPLAGSMTNFTAPSRMARLGRAARGASDRVLNGEISAARPVHSIAGFPRDAAGGL